MGGVLFFAAPTTAVLAVLVWRFADRDPAVVLLHAWLARVGVLVGSLLGIAGITFGVWGIRLANRRRQCTGLALAGLLISVLSSVAWSIVSIGFLNTTESLLQNYGR